MSTITLSRNQSEVLARLGADAERSAEDLARQLGISARAARYAMDSLVRLKIAEPRLVVDLGCLGLARYHLLFSIAAAKRKDRNVWLKQIVESESTLFLAEMGGRFDYQLSIAASGAGGALDILSSLSGFEIREKALTVRVKQAQFPRRYLAPSVGKEPGLETGKKRSMVVLDALDHRVLSVLSSDPRISKQRVAAKLKVPASTVVYRLNRLRENGVLIGTSLGVDCSRYGAQAYIVTLSAKGFPSASARGLFQFAVENPYCTHIVQCLGAWDFELGIEVPTHADLSAILDEISDRFGSALAAMEVHPRYRILKYNSYPFKENPTRRNS